MKLLRWIPVLIPLLLQAQTAHKFCAVFGSSSGYEYGNTVKQTLDHGYIVAGSTNSTGSGIMDGYIVKTDTIGLAQWEKFYGGNNIDHILSLDQLPDSGYVFAGYTNSYGSGGYDGWLLRTDKNGDTLWTKTYGGTDWDLFYSVKATFDGGFIMAGGTYSSGHGDEDVYVIKTDANGTIQWTKTYGGTRQDEASAVVQYALDSGYVIAATTHSLGDTLGDGWLLRLDQNGDSIWGKKLGRPDTADALNAVSYYKPNGLITAVGQTESVAGNIDGAWYDLFSNGSPVFPPSYNPGPQNEWHAGIAFHRDGRSGIIGSNYSAGSGNGDFWFIERNFTGFCYTTFGTLMQDEGRAIDTTSDKGYISCGFTTGYSGALPDMYLMKIDSACTSTIVLGIFEAPAPESNGVNARLLPNPISSEGRLQITSRSILPNAQQLQVLIYDLSGRCLGNAEEEIISSSPHSAEIRISRETLAAGAYIWQLSDGKSLLSSGKMIVGEK